MKNYLKIIRIDEYVLTPKYQQVSHAILRGVEDGLIGEGEILPSINDLSTALEVSRKTIEKAYKELKRYRVICSVAGKGYFIAAAPLSHPVRVLLLFNKLSAHKKVIYDAFAQTLGVGAVIDFYIYNNSFSFFKKLLAEKAGDYSRLAILPHFTEDAASARAVLDALPKGKLILMDRMVEGLSGDFGAVYEDFEQDIYGALEQLLDRLEHYHTLKIIVPQNSYHPKAILTGFLRFSRQYAFDYQVIHDLAPEELVKGTVYINLVEEDLVTLIEKIIGGGLVTGQDIGVISYNEAPLKRIILDGITTISTDFALMGEQAARMVLDGSTAHFAVPFRVNRRNSL